MGGKSGGKQTTSTEPPKYVRPYLQGAVRDAQSLYQQGGPDYYPGNTVVPFSPQTEQAMGLTQQRALSGSPVTNAAQGYATDVLSGNYLNNNPYLDATFNRAADQVQNRIQSGFAGSGRNIEAGRPLAAQEMNDLASQIYGGAYDNERQRMGAMTAFAPQLAEQDYRDLGALGGVGSQVEDLTGRLMQDQAARWDFDQNRAGNNLNDYIARLNQYPGSTQTTPTYQNRGAGALGGAMTGGAMFGPWGALGGAVLGGLL